jgi:hypothetical protein
MKLLGLASIINIKIEAVFALMNEMNPVLHVHGPFVRTGVVR